MLRVCCKVIFSLCLILFLARESVAVAQSGNWRISLEAPPHLHQEPFTGRVYLFLKSSSIRDRKEPRMGPDWFHPQPFVAKDVVDWVPGTRIELDFADPQLLKFPQNLTEQALQGMLAQAVVRANPHEREVGTGPGNWFSQTYWLQAPGEVVFRTDRVVPEMSFQETHWTKLLRLKSERVSRFLGRDAWLQAAVTLPASYHSQPEKRYPVILEIPGFGGNHHHGIHHHPVPERNGLGVEFIRVMLDPNCELGHHVFANSANNGPWMDAFIDEFLPALDAQFRTDARPEARFLTGHSSGGWSSLWLMVQNPELFAGTWSTAPDSVTFRDFQLINLYRTGENMFVDEQGQRRPLGRVRRQAVVYYDTFSQMEDVLGHGGQLRSFEAVFSPRGPDGKPLRLWNRSTGAIDPQVAQSWKPYDILLHLEENWEKLGPRLAGKIHVYMGGDDTFYLEGATILLQESMRRRGSDAPIEIFPGRDHMNLFDGGLDQRIEQEMAEKYRSSRIHNLHNPSESTIVK